MEYRYTAIILKKKEIGETDRLYTVYTKEAGKLRVTAKGVRKPEAKLAGQLETLNAVTLSVQRGRGQGKISGAFAEDFFSDLRRKPEAMTDVLRAVSRFEEQVGLEEPDEKLFSLLESFLVTTNALAPEKSDRIPVLCEGFLVQMLECLGYRIEANVCAASGERLSENDRFFFSPAEGGVVSAGMARGGAQATPISVGGVKLLRIFLSNRLEHIAKISVEGPELREVALAVRRLFEWIGK